MKRWCIAVVLIAAFLCVSAAGAVKPDKGPVDKIVLVHYKDAPAKPSTGGGDSAAMFKLMGVKWDTANFPVTYHVNATGSGLDPNAVGTEMMEAFNEWDKASGQVAFTSDVSSNPDDPVVPGKANSKNDVTFARLDSANAIAVTTVWYYTVSKEIVEADIQMNTRMRWGIDSNDEASGNTLTNAYDVRNIATHEIGHVCGLADLYTARSSQLTMYGYGGIGEVKKDSLEAGDIAGLQKLYGA